MDSKSLLGRIERLVEIGVALSAEGNTDRLLETILMGAKTITGADGGTLYLMEEEARSLRMAIVRTDSMAFAMGGSTGEPIPFPAIPLYDESGRPDDSMVVTYAVHHDRTVNIPDAYDTEVFDFSGTRAFDERTGYRSQSFLTVPLKDHEGAIIGVLQLLNAVDEATGAIVPFSPESERLAQSLASQAAIALTNKRLISDLRGLFDSLIQLIADAIDEKSPYTGGHCRRVPVITMLLADAVAGTREGPFSDFVMTEDDRYELETAAWLHDCGKIATPEHVIDKATKLETIYDRIHAVDTRFEVLRRDAEIARLRRELETLREGLVPDTAALDRELHATLSTLAEEQALVRRSNPGGEDMEPAEQARLAGIARRHFLDHAGHRVALLDGDELANLMIPKGTLTAAERQIINSHIDVTLQMLERLPFPKNLRNVPEFAGGHHERVDGKGYPKGLTGNEMSVQARIMAIADVFEALTAGDRPYKPAKKLSETLGIMARMAAEGHLDAALFDVFLQREVYLDYARTHLKPEQIDDVDAASLRVAGWLAG
ncbi:HD-GYP domain-containing protein [Thioalkalivibrio thiocyanodenitrificans]|uniref:HD-GYP domain-containing protein n=1 Tax=Thioalkalivibrio thiocyanodenitrificans TaxID=243063 RepID=UPI00037BDA1E|nr:HD family phosphohydrolase [Thioalkalivibrio thiocyanodenitrificans]